MIALRNLAVFMGAMLAVAGGQTPAPVRMAPPARITDFKAQPSSIQPGQSVTLSWATENPYTVTIDPAPGLVTPRGSVAVTPKATTTYTLTVRGTNNSTLTKELIVTVAGTTPIRASKAVQTPAIKTVPRTPDGRPDFSGVYSFSISDSFGNARGRGSVSIGPELKPGMEKYRTVRPTNDPGPLSDCMPIAGPLAFTVPYPFQIVQSPSYVVIFHEFPGVFRIIPTNGATHPVDPDPTWLGDSTGRWDNDTLIVDTIGFNTKTELSGLKHSEKLHIVERFTRPGFDTLHYEATLEDPDVFVRPWTVSNSFPLRPELKKIDEFVCENKKDYSGFFKK